MTHWTEDEGLRPVYADAFGGRIYDIPFYIEEEEGLGEDRPTDEDAEGDASEQAAAKSADSAMLVIHPGGQEVWTRSGFDFALELLNHRKDHSQPDLFAA